MGLFGFGKQDNDPPPQKPEQQKHDARNARYKDRPLLLILDNYIIDCLGQLPPDKQQGLTGLVKQVFGGGDDWRMTVRATLKLHDNIDMSIRQAWSNFHRDHPSTSPFAFAVAFSDSHFVPLIEGTPSNRGDRQTDPAQQREAAERKNRSLTILRQHNVPFIEHLPTIETAATATIRQPGEVARRATVLALVAAYAEPGSFPVQELRQLLDKRGVASNLTPNEQQFIARPNPTEHQRAQFTWRYECVKVLLWALGHIEQLDFPGNICDVQAIVRIIAQSDPAKFLAEAQLRDSTAILDEADLIYRYDWACVNARVKNQPAPAGLEPGVVVERHHALNWLIGYSGQEWDDVSTDT